MVGQNTKIELNAVIVAVAENNPQILIDPRGALPSGPFETGHHTLEQGLRDWAGLPLGYVEQLYTFADKDRATGEQRFVSIGYLALVRAAVPPKQALWSPWYKHLPWEDHRKGVPTVIAKAIMPGLTKWKASAPDAAVKRSRAQRIVIAFPKDMRRWNEELVLQRYELLWEAGLVEEAVKRKTGLSPSRSREGLKRGMLRPILHWGYHSPTIIAASWRPPSPAYARRLNIVRWCSNFCRIALHYCNCKARLKHWRDCACTNKISVAWWKHKGWSRKPTR